MKQSQALSLYLVHDRSQVISCSFKPAPCVSHNLFHMFSYSSEPSCPHIERWCCWLEQVLSATFPSSFLASVLSMNFLNDSQHWPVLASQSPLRASHSHLNLVVSLQPSSLRSLNSCTSSVFFSPREKQSSLDCPKTFRKDLMG